MHDFATHNETLHCETTPLPQLADTYGTPLYVYSRKTLERHYKVFDHAFQDAPHIICFAAKANSNLALLNLLGQMGGGADIVSGGELYRCLKAGISPDKIVYSGVGKTPAEMQQALEADILMFNIESFQELQLLDSVAGKCGRRARISLRVNPDVDPKTHPYVATGLKTSKFGIVFESAIEGYARAKNLKHIEVVGVDCHIGSQLTELAPFVDAVKRLRQLVFTLRDQGFDIRYLDLGGGLGITYDAEDPPSPSEYGEAILKVLEGSGITIILEPGRNLVGNAGILLSRVLYTKNTGEKRFVIVDAGMNDLLRPSLYNSYHRIRPVTERKGPWTQVDVVGPVCESGDFLAQGRALPPFEQGDLIAVMSAGAYGSTMSSEYNSRPKAAEILVDGREHHIIRERGSYEDLLRGERLMPRRLGQ